MWVIRAHVSNICQRRVSTARPVQGHKPFLMSLYSRRLNQGILIKSIVESYRSLSTDVSRVQRFTDVTTLMKRFCFPFIGIINIIDITR